MNKQFQSIYSGGEATKNKLSITKGKHPQYGEILLWDHVPDCRGVNCPAYRPCHWTSKDTVGSKCYVIMTYLRSITNRIFREVGCDITQIQKSRVGLELIPLYRLLIRLKIEELGVGSLSYTTPKGMIAIHPIVKEIRETIKAIEGVMAAIGIHDLDISVNLRFEKHPQTPTGSMIPKAKSYYEMVEMSAVEEKRDSDAKAPQLIRRQG